MLGTSLSELLYLSDGSSSHKNLPLRSGNAARLKEKHGGVSKQANAQIVLRSTRSPPMLVMFKYENLSALNLP